jgi:hypothetical protein
MEKASKDVSNDNKEVRGKSVTLTQATPAVDPSTGVAIHEDGSFARAQRSLNPVTPVFRKATEDEDVLRLSQDTQSKALWKSNLRTIVGHCHW